MKKSGVLAKDYTKKRENRKTTYFSRALRRTYEACASINRLDSDDVRILDLGCAESLSFEFIKKYCNKNSHYFGLEYNKEIINRSENVICGNISSLPVKTDSIDIVIATAVIEHVEELDIVLHEVSGVLKENGILLITMPDPFWEKFAHYLGNIEETGFHDPYPNKTLIKTAENHGLKLTDYYKFMITPMGYIWEKKFEKIIPDFLLLNRFFEFRKNND
ncbi:MAG: class I SAM-dependent methyltransferase [Candidatus Muiribacteriaceae bacterium]